MSFIGAGSYAQGNLLPNLPSDPRVARRGVLTHSGTTSRRVAERFGFAFAADSADQILNDDATQVVFIATRHDTHGEYVRRALAAGKHVFVEKPVCLTLEELVAVREAYRASDNQQLLVGFNRRFSPHTLQLKGRLGTAPLAMVYRINAGAIPADTWIQDPQIGGGRILGEACHFIDLMTFLCGSVPRVVYARSIPDPHQFHDTVSIEIEFAGGSIGTVHYFANGPKGMSKESLEVFQSGQAFHLDDFRSLSHYRGGKPWRSRTAAQDKGQSAMVRQFLDRILEGGEPLIPFDQLFAVHAACHAALESLRTASPVRIAAAE